HLSRDDGEGPEGFQQGHPRRRQHAGRAALSAAARSGAEGTECERRRDAVMANRLPFIAVLVAIVLFLAYSSIFVVNARQQALVLRFGEIVDVKSEPGIYFKLPFSMFEADYVQMIEKPVLRFDL